MEAYIESILDQNTFNDVGDIILYPHIFISSLSQDLVDILVVLH